jgi:DNA-directed RNA polymerase subunit RPC12/RpoP
MTPARLVEIECPNCRHRHWVIDHDFRGMGGTGHVELAYEDRRYECPSCGGARTGWAVIQNSPPEFLLQPHDLYPMTPSEFDHWVTILKANFPTHPRLADLGRGFFPRTPEEVQARKEEYARAHPIVEMRDQDGSRVAFPELRQALDWLEVMRPNDSLTFLHTDGGSLQVTLPAPGAFRVRCLDAQGGGLAESARLDEGPVRACIQRYLIGDAAGAVGHLRTASRE